MATAEEIKTALEGGEEVRPAPGPVDSAITPPQSAMPSPRPSAMGRTDALEQARQIKGQTDPGFWSEFGKGAQAAGIGLRNLLVQAMTGQKLTPPERPDSMPGRMGEVAAEAGIAAIPIGGALTKVAPALKGATGAASKVRNVASDIGQSFARNPVRFTATEAALGASAGAGGYITEQMYPDSPGARLIGELLGGSAPSLLPTGWAVRGAQNIRRQGRSQLTPQRSMERAQGRFVRATPDREGASSSMGEELLPGLTPAGQAGDEGLLSLTASVDQELADADKFLQRSTEAAQQNIDEAIRSFGQTSPEAARRTYEQAQQRLLDGMDARIRMAAQEADNKIAKAGPSMTREAANRVFYDELTSALSKQREIEASLYNKIPSDAIVPTSNARQTYRRLLSGLSRAQSDDMPQVARRLLRGEEGLGATTNIQELRGLQSELRRVARNARAGDDANFNKARIADELADSITSDIANAQGSPEIGDLVSTAVGFSRQLNQKFRQGTVGDILGYGIEGGVRVPAGLSLERSLGLSGPRGREAFDDILNAVDNEAVRNSLDDYIKNRFVDYAVVNGTVDRNKVTQFIRNNREVLNRMPDTFRDINDVGVSLDVKDLKMRQRKRVNFKPSVSRATMFIERSPEAAFRGVVGSRNPTREMRKLINMAKRDETGEALEGIKSAFSDFIQGQATSRGVVTGAGLDAAINANPGIRRAMEQIYSPEEIRRWETIARTAKRADMQRAAKPSGEGVTGDRPGRVATLLARLLGAHSGSQVAGVTGTGGIQMQALMSNAYRDLLKRGMDPARRLIMDAVQDEELFKEVLMAEIKPDGTLPEQTRRRLNAWIVTIAPEEDEETE